MKNYLLAGLLLLGTVCSCTESDSYSPHEYAVSDSPWNEAFGNHRIVFSIEQPAEAVKLSVDWRRPDLNVGQHRFLLIHAESGDTVQNIRRLHVNNEQCELICGPIKKPGTYYFYYLPYRVQQEHGFYHKGYYPAEADPDSKWLVYAKKLADMPSASLVRIEARTVSDSFYPMEVIATKAECDSFKQAYPAEFWVFPEDRKYPIRMKKRLPYKWIQQVNLSDFYGEAMQNEYYTFQLGVWAGKEKITNLTYSTDGLLSGTNVIEADAITCFNMQGVNSSGKTFTKHIDIPKGEVQPLWFGVDIAKDQPAGIYEGTLMIQEANGHKIPIDISIEVTQGVLADRGDSETWRHSRLRWLNSTLGITDQPTSGYTKIQADIHHFSCLGRTLQLSPLTALPQSIDAWQHELLAAPLRFVIETNQGIKRLQGTTKLEQSNEGMAMYSWVAEDESLQLKANIRMEFDGWINYVYTLYPKRTFTVNDIRLEIPLKETYSSYIMGMGLPGQYTPKHYKGKWNTAEEKVNHYGVSLPVSEKKDWLWPFDSFWCGSEKAGIHCELRGSSYTGPLLNLYRPPYPASWYNEGKGGFKVNRHTHQTLLTAYSGRRTLKEKQPIDFDFAMLVTPVKQIDWHSQFTNRYYHKGGAPTPDEQNLKDGVRVINVHGGLNLIPFINYPVLLNDYLTEFIHHWHEKGCKVKLYYTVRELSNAANEIWALRSLGNEVLAGGKGGGYPWCQEHFVTDYTPQWYTHYKDQFPGYTAEASILTATGDSRWYNYYIEGLKWMAQQTDMDGIYMDDVAFERDMVKRIRHALDEVKPGCLIDLHSNTGFSRGPAIQYTTFFPYIDKLWFGESYMYSDMSPDNWLVEVSGIPFGLTGDMLHRGGNKWLGMQYGMTVRQDWITDNILCEPRYIWRLWNKFGIEEAKVEGFWETNPVVRTTDDEVKVTAFIKKDSTLLSIGNYSEKDKKIKLMIDWERIGLDPQKVKLITPTIQDFQETQNFKLTNSLPVKAKQGWLIIMTEK